MHYYSYNRYLKEKYGTKVRKICIDAGFGCPNKDGTLSKDGCIFCNEEGFSLQYGTERSVEKQIEDAIKTSKCKKSIAYFQNAAGTNASCKELKKVYDAVKNYPEIVSISISTRPDCVNDEKLELIKSYTDEYEVWVEYGLQTIHDATLRRVDRGHTYFQTEEAIRRTSRRGIKVGVHVILGLPGESREDMLATARRISFLPVNGVKIHLLHVLKDTKLAEQYAQGKIELFDLEGYISAICDFLEYIREDIVILRLVSEAQDEYLIAPKWMNDKRFILNEIEKEFASRGTRQGFRVH